MAMKGYSTLLRALELESSRQMQFSVVLKISPLYGSYPSAKDTVGIFQVFPVEPEFLFRTKLA